MSNKKNTPVPPNFDDWPAVAEAPIEYIPYPDDPEPPLPPTQRSMPQQNTSVSSMTSLVVTGVLSACMAISATLLLVKYGNIVSVPVPETEAQQVRVVDLLGLSFELSKKKGLSAEETEREMRRIASAIEHIKDQGVIVLDAQQVIAAPHDLFLQLPTLQALGNIIGSTQEITAYELPEPKSINTPSSKEHKGSQEIDYELVNEAKEFLASPFYFGKTSRVP